MGFTLEYQRYGDGWKKYAEDYEIYDNPETLEQWVEVGEDQETYDGRYEYRIVDDNGIVMWTKIPPSEGVHLNLAQDGWMNDIQSDYGLDNTVWAKACRQWLAQHPEIQ